MSSVRVLVTGLGVLSPLGNTVESFWQALLTGRDGIGEIECLDTAMHRTSRGGEVRGFDPESFLGPGRARSLGRASQYAIAAAGMALADASIDPSAREARRIGVSIGTTSGEIQILEKVGEALIASGPEGIGEDHLFSQYPCGSIPANVADEFALCGPNNIFPTACAAGNYAIGWAFDEIRRGNAEVMLAGGVDPFSRITFTGFNRLRSVAPDRCCPFDRDRKGMIVSEGAAVLVLESLPHALKRGAHGYAEVLGYGLSCDAHHMTSPEPTGEGIARALRQALESCGIEAGDVDYVCAHGTGTPANDKAEAAGLSAVFGAGAGGIPVSSVKSMLGHTMGAASAIEAAVTALAVERDFLPPTINFENPDEDCPLDCVPNRARAHRIDVALSNAFAFGGNNSVLVLGKYEAGSDDE